MNTIQKVCAMVGAFSFTMWLFNGIGIYSSLGDIFTHTSHWFNSTDEIVPFAIAVASVVGFFLFKDKK